MTETKISNHLKPLKERVEGFKTLKKNDIFIYEYVNSEYDVYLYVGFMIEMDVENEIMHFKDLYDLSELQNSTDGYDYSGHIEDIDGFQVVNVLYNEASTEDKLKEIIPEYFL